MDCVNLPDSSEYNCTNLWASNCTNTVGFDFATLWNITQRIQGYCPTDPRLFLNGNTPATAENAALTSEACIALAKQDWQYYPRGDIWVRLTTWKFPLLQLVASSPRPPLGFAVESFAILHLMGDPIGTIRDLFRGISSCQHYADFWKNYLDNYDRSERHLTPDDKDYAWKAFTIITVSYDEWGKGDEVRKTLQQAMDSFLNSEDSTIKLDNFLRLIELTADALAADRATNFFPIIVAEGFFVGAIGIAIAKIKATSPIPANLFINVEAHSIAFSALYLWIVPAVILTSIIGVSQTQNAIPRILRRLQTGLDLELRRVPEEERITLPNHVLRLATEEEKIKLPNYVLGDNQRRILNGGVYSWLPERPDRYESRKALPLLQRNGLPITLVIAGTITAMLVSGYVPPDGWDTRHFGEISLLIAWLVSFALTCVLKRYRKGAPRTYNNKGRFWLTWAKDALATAVTMGGIIATQVGIFHRCDSYTRWGRTGLALPEMPDVADVLLARFGTVYPAIVFVSIGLQLVVMALVAIRYRRAWEVFFQRDDRDSGSWSGRRRGGSWEGRAAVATGGHSRGTSDGRGSEDEGMVLLTGTNVPGTSTTDGVGDNLTNSPPPGHVLGYHSQGLATSTQGV